MKLARARGGVGVTISEGALANLFKRAKPRFDETSARVGGGNWWDWVFLGTDAVLHVIEPSREAMWLRLAAFRGPVRPIVPA